MRSKSISCNQSGHAGQTPDTGRTVRGRTRTPLYRGVRDVRSPTSEPMFPAAEAWAPSPSKRCITCKLAKRRSAEDFRRHLGSRDGLRRTCRECLETGRYRSFIENPDQRAKRKARESKPKWQALHKLALARHAGRYPVNQLATKAVQAALKDGRLAKPPHCQAKDCTSTKRLEAHHWSLKPEHWLDVTFCCAACHRKGHFEGRILLKDGIPEHYGSIPEKHEPLAVPKAPAALFKASAERVKLVGAMIAASAVAGHEGRAAL